MSENSFQAFARAILEVASRGAEELAAIRAILEAPPGTAEVPASQRLRLSAMSIVEKAQLPMIVPLDAAGAPVLPENVELPLGEFTAKVVPLQSGFALYCTEADFAGLTLAVSLEHLKEIERLRWWLRNIDRMHHRGAHFRDFQEAIRSALGGASAGGTENV